jgi:hypothetical protein
MEYAQMNAVNAMRLSLDQLKKEAVQKQEEKEGDKSKEKGREL